MKLFKKKKPETATSNWFKAGGKEVFEETLKKYRSFGLSEIRLSNFNIIPRGVNLEELPDLISESICPCVRVKYIDAPGEQDIVLYPNGYPEGLHIEEGGFCYE